MINRPIQLENILRFRNTPELIKVITGVRRSGKSTMMQLYRRQLIDGGIPESAIIYVNFEDFRFRDITSADKLHDYILAIRPATGVSYIMLDEVQLVPDWEQAVNSLRLDRKNDIYLTGSNAAMLSGTLATLLSGRYVEIKILPLSFEEFAAFRHTRDKEITVTELFNRYLLDGGFPGLIDITGGSGTVNDYLTGILNTIIVKDIAAVGKVRDVDILRKIIDFASSNIGNYLTASKISGYLTSTGRKVTPDTVDSYLRLLEDAFVFYRAQRYNLKGKHLLKTNNKFYIVDLGLRNILTGVGGQDYGASLENIVFFELLRRGYQVCVGKYDDLEIDFVASKPDARMYIQVSATIMDENTRNRELKPLKALDDNYPKTLLTMDRLPYSDFEGIRQINIIDFLLSKTPL